MANDIIEIETWSSFSGQTPSAYSPATTCSFDFTIDSTTRGKSFHDLITINKLYGTYKVGYLTFTFSGSTNLTVRVVNGSITKTGQIGNNNTYVQWVNYNHNDTSSSGEFYTGYNDFYIDIPSSGPGGEGTITIKWNAVDDNDGRLASYTVDTTTFLYDGQQHHISLSSATGCSIVTTTYGTNIDTYNQVITATNGTSQFSDCYYFRENGTPVATSTQSWQIVANTDRYIWINTNGTPNGWKRAIVWININGTSSGWRKATVWINTNGTSSGWKECNG